MLIRRLFVVCWFLLGMIGCQPNKEPKTSETDQSRMTRTKETSALPVEPETEPAKSETGPSGAEPMMEPSGQTDPTVGLASKKEPVSKKEAADKKEVDSKGSASGVKSGTALSVVRDWLLNAADPNSMEKAESLESLDALGERAVQQAALVLDDDDPVARRAAATYLVGRVSMRNKKVIRALAETLSSDDSELRHRSFLALERLPGQALGDVSAELAVLLSNPKEDEVYRVRAARVLGRIPQVGLPATRALQQAASKQVSLRLRRASLGALAKVADPEEAEGVFLKILRSDDPAEFRALTATWLARVARTKDGLQGLIVALDDAEPTVRKAASEGLVAIGKPAVPALIAVLDSSSVQRRRYAIFALGKMGPLAAGATQSLEKQAKDPNPEIQRLAKAALGLVRKP